jgi:hypothetical protein
MKRKREEQPRAEPESWFSEEEQAADRAEAARERRRRGGREPSAATTAYWRVPVACMAEDVRLYVERGVPQGSFLTALFSNDLTAAFQCADAPNTAAMRAWVMFMLNEMPINSHGGPEAVRAWIARGGLAGVRTEAGG